MAKIRSNSTKNFKHNIKLQKLKSWAISRKEKLKIVYDIKPSLKTSPVPIFKCAKEVKF